MTDAHIDFLIQHNLKSGYDFDPEDCQEFFGKATSSCPNNYGHTQHTHSHNHSPPHATHLYNLDDPFYSKIRFLQTLHSPTHSHSDNEQSSCASSSSPGNNPGNSSDNDHQSSSMNEQDKLASTRRSSRIQSRAMAAAALKSNKPSHADQDRINRMRAARAVPHQIIQTLRKEVKMDPNDSEYFDHTRPHLTSQQIHWRHFLIVDLADTKHPRGQGHDKVPVAETSSMARQPEFVFHFPSKFWYTKDEVGKPGFLSLMKGLKREYHVKLDLSTDEHDPDSDDLIVSVKSRDDRTLRKASAQIADWARALCPN